MTRVPNNVQKHKSDVKGSINILTSFLKTWGLKELHLDFSLQNEATHRIPTFASTTKSCQHHFQTLLQEVLIEVIW